MKRITNIYKPLALLFVIISFNACKRIDDTTELTAIKMEDPVRHYSPIMQGIKQNIIVRITNTGNKPLVLKNVLPSCGCTIAKFPSHGIAPGNDAEIKMVYDSSKNTGYTAVYTTINANTKTKIHTFLFDINVVPNSLHTKDYEEIHAEREGQETYDSRDEVDKETHIRYYNVK